MKNDCILFMFIVIWKFCCRCCQFYQAGRKDGVKEALRDLRRFAQYVVKEGTCTKEDIFNLIDHKYEEIGEISSQKKQTKEKK